MEKTLEILEIILSIAVLMGFVVGVWLILTGSMIEGLLLLILLELWKIKDKLT